MGGSRRSRTTDRAARVASGLMARRRVTYLEVADDGLPQGRRSALLDLDPAARRSTSQQRAPVRRERRPCPAWVALFALVALVAAGALLAEATTSPDEEAAAERADDRQSPKGPDLDAPAPPTGPLVVATRSIVGEPWGGVFEHHPDARGADPVPRVHVLTLGGPGGRGLLVVDATRRAFGGPEHPTAVARAARTLGSDQGDGLRTLQWDANGYGLSLTTVGLTAADQRAAADAVRLPEGPSLLHGRSPGFDGTILREVGLEVVYARNGPASALGSPLIGQSGAASVEGQLHQDGRAALLVSVVQDQLADASWLRGALGPTVAIDASVLPGIVTAAGLDHGPAAASGRRIRGQARLVLDHVDGATIELSSDVLRPAELLEAAADMDLARLVRTTAPVDA